MGHHSSNFPNRNTVPAIFAGERERTFRPLQAANGGAAHGGLGRRLGSVRLTGWQSCGSISGMSITIELPPDVDQQVKEIPDVEQRVVSFLRNQVEYEKWRKQRYSAKALRLVEESKAEAEQLRASGKSREELFEEFMVLHEGITKQIAEKS